MVTVAYPVEVKLPGGEQIKTIQQDAMRMSSFLTIKVKEMSVSHKKQGVWFTITAIFTSNKDALMFRLKWA